MKIAQAKLIYLFITGMFFLGACARDNNKNTNPTPSNAAQTSDAIDENNKANQSQDDIGELGKIVKLPLAPEEATWREENSSRNDGENRPPSQNNKKLVAVLRYSPPEANQIVAQAEKYQSPTSAEIDTESWFPAELVAQSQLSGDETLKGTSYAANDFFQPPFNNGKITRIADTDYFVLELASF